MITNNISHWDAYPSIYFASAHPNDSILLAQSWVVYAAAYRRVYGALDEIIELISEKDDPHLNFSAYLLLVFP